MRGVVQRREATTTRRRARATTVRAADDAAEADAAMVQNNAIGRAARGKAKKTTASSSSSSSSTTTAAAAPAATRPPLLNVLADDALGPAHASATTWIVFSDLHVNRKTSDVCVQVLDAVLAAARAKNAGVVFLGDWWHARGAIPVEPLNASLDAIRAWDVPVVMIPGNHDQVTAGGELHALAPLRRVLRYHLALVPMRPRSRGARRSLSLRTFSPGARAFL